MKQVHCFNYELVKEDLNTPTYALTLNGNAITEGPFNQVEAQYQVGDNYIVVGTTDDMRAEVLQAYLISANGKVKDKAQYTGWYTAFEVLSVDVKDNELCLVLTKGIKVKFGVKRAGLFKKLALEMTPILP